MMPSQPPDKIYTNIPKRNRTRVVIQVTLQEAGINPGLSFSVNASYLNTVQIKVH